MIDTLKKAGWLDEFKTFIARGNVVDLAVGIILGAAFTSVVNSLVSDVLMPPIGMLAGGLDFSNYFFVLKGEHAPTLKAAKDAGTVTVNYGLFLNSIINFLIVSVAVFILVKQVAKLRVLEQMKPPSAPTPSENLLMEIRDLLKTR